MSSKVKRVLAAMFGAFLMAGTSVPVVYADADTKATMPASDLQHIKLVDTYNPEGIKDKPLQNATIGLCERSPSRSFFSGKFVGYSDPYDHDPSHVKTFTTDKDGTIDITAADFINADGKAMDLYPSGEWNPKGVTTYKSGLYYSDRVVLYNDGVLKFDTRNTSVSADGHTLIIQAEPAKFSLKLHNVSAEEDLPEIGALDPGSGEFLDYEIRDAAGKPLTPVSDGGSHKGWQTYAVNWGERYTYHQRPDALDAGFYVTDFDFTPLYNENISNCEGDDYAAIYNLTIPIQHPITVVEQVEGWKNLEKLKVIDGKMTAYAPLIDNGGILFDSKTGEEFGNTRKREVKNGDELDLSKAVFPFTNPKLIIHTDHPGVQDDWKLYDGQLPIYHFEPQWRDDDTGTVIGSGLGGLRYQILRQKGQSSKWLTAEPLIVGDDYTITLPAVQDTDDYIFDGWYTKAEGGTRLGGSGNSVVLNYTGKLWGEMTDRLDDLMKGEMYAHWTKKAEYTVNYDANGGHGTMEADVYKGDADATLDANTFTKTGYTFIGWAIEPDGDVVYNDKAEIGQISKAAVNDNALTVYAKWHKTTAWDGLTISKDVDKDVAQPGDTLTYTVTVSNKTGKNLTGITVSDALDSRLTFVSADSESYSNGAWAIDDLSDGETKTLTLKAKVNNDVADKAVIPNAASITGAHADDGNMPDDHHATDETQTTVNVPVNWSGLKVDKTVDKDVAKPGDTISYTITVSNDTGKDLTDVVVTDNLDANLTLVSADNDGYSDGTWTIVSLKDGESATLTLTAKVNEDVADKTVLPNVAEITNAHNGDETLPSDNHPSDKVETKIDVPTDWTKLTVAKTVDKETAKPGDEVKYTITVSNDTGKDLTGITVADKLDDGLTFVSADSDTYKDDVWTIDSLADGEKATLTITAKVKDDVADKTIIPNVATITGAHADDGDMPKDNQPSAKTQTVIEIPIHWDGLTIQKTADREVVKAGDKVTYTIAVTNNTGKNLTDVKVADELDKNVTFVFADSDVYKDGVWTISKLDKGHSDMLKITVKVKDGVKDGTVIPNTAVITDARYDGGALPKDNRPSDDVDVTVENPPVETPADWTKLVIEKTVDKATAKPGEEVRYTVKVKNGTGKDLTGVVVEDVLDKNLAFDTFGSNVGKYDAGTGVWKFDTLVNGGTAQLDITVKVKDGTADKAEIPNVATITDAHSGDEELPKDARPSAKVDVTIDNPAPEPVKEFQVTYDSNGGNGAMNPTKIGENGKVTLDANVFTKDGYTFKGWAIKKDGDVVYADKDVLTGQTSDLTLYAVWEKKPVEQSKPTGVQADKSVTYAGVGMLVGIGLLLAVVLTGKHRKAE